jgi:hypothetical protein
MTELSKQKSSYLTEFMRKSLDIWISYEICSDQIQLRKKSVCILGAGLEHTNGFIVIILAIKAEST